jgi:O-succinylbenzoate synthase
MESLVADLRAALEAGYALVTLKLRPGWDIEMLRALRQEFAAAPLAVDCDGLCSLGQQEMFYRLEDFFLQSIEQPLPADDLVGHAMLQQNLRTPVALDQSVTSPTRVEQALDLGSCRQVRIDPARVGGLTSALAIHDVCRAANVECAVGGNANAGVAATATMALAARCEAMLSDDVLSGGSVSWCSALPHMALEKNSRGKLEIRPAANAPILDAQAVADAAIEQITLR